MQKYTNKIDKKENIQKNQLNFDRERILNDGGY